MNLFSRRDETLRNKRERETGRTILIFFLVPQGFIPPTKQVQFEQLELLDYFILFTLYFIMLILHLYHNSFKICPKSGGFYNFGTTVISFVRAREF